MVQLVGITLQDVIRHRPVVICAIMIIAALVCPGAASERVPVQLSAITQAEGYARVIVTFPKPPKYAVSVDSGVLIIEFEEPVSAVLDAGTVNAPEFIIVGRVDPDGKTLRFALAQNVRVNTMEAGEHLFVDLLPQNWQGVAPGLPPAVVAELARRAREAEKTAEIEARRRALEKSKYKLRIQVGQQPTFSRIVFDWGARVGVQLSRKGAVITVAFDQFAKPPMARLKSDPPRYVRSAREYYDDDGLRIELTIDEESDVRGFREENTYIVDVSAPPGAVNQDNSPVTSLSGDETVAPEPAVELIELNGQTESAEPVAPATPTGEAPDRVAVSTPTTDRIDPDANPDADTETAAARPESPAAPDAQETEDEPVPEVVVAEYYLNSDGSDLATAAQANADGEIDASRAPDAEPEQSADENATAVDDKTPRRETPMFGTRPVAPEPKEAPAVAAVVEVDSAAETEAQSEPDTEAARPVVVTAERKGEVLRVRFPFARPTAAAVFRRADTLWLVFESDQTIDVSAIENPDADFFVKAGLMQSGETQIVRFKLHDSALSSTAADGDAWVLSLAGLVVTPSAPVSLKRGLRSDGRAKVTVAFENASKVHHVKDPDVGDELSIVTGLGPQRGMVKAQHFVEFSVLQTSHGLAVKTLADDVRVRLLDDGVLITRSGGLTLSSSGNDLGDPQSGASDTSRPGFVDYERWSPGGPEDFMDRMNLLESAIATLEPSQTLGPRLDLVRLYLANDLGGEAIGQLLIIEDTDPELQSEPMFAALCGIARVLMRRPEQARQRLSNFALKKDPHTALWRGVLAVQENAWNEATGNFRTGEFAIAEYPPDQQVRFRIAAMRAAVEMNDFATADFHYNLLPAVTLTPADAGEVLVLRGRLLDGLGRSVEAFDILAQALESRDRKAEAEAMYHHALLGRRLDKLSRAQLQTKLETLAAIWRGDDLELNTLRRLASFYVEDEEFGNALQVMKVAVISYPKASLASDIHDDMTSLFESLYLDGQADKLKPVEALALYYQYRELTPVGRRGDEMIRKLADRLISVDLLDQAIEILNHQVDKRLIGAARAQVAAKLAMVHLMNRKPARALNAIRRTRQAVLPQHIQSQRRLIEARALSELGRTSAAVDLLAHVDGEEALRQRGEAFWTGERWQKSGENFEQLLGEAATNGKPLSSLQRIDLLRAAVSYVLADDNIGLDRLRSRFETKMAGTPDESAFEVVTRPLNRGSIAFRNLAREIASIDTLETFLRKFRDTFDAVSVEADAALQN